MSELNVEENIGSRGSVRTFTSFPAFLPLIRKTIGYGSRISFCGKLSSKKCFARSAGEPWGAESDQCVLDRKRSLSLPKGKMHQRCGRW